MCLAQRDIKRLIAYSSVCHLGYCMLGMLAITAEGATGAAYQMLNHGVSTGALFLLFGMLYERRHTRLMSDYGGIAKVMPVFTAFVPHHHLLVGGGAGHQRLHRRVPGAAGHVQELACRLASACSPPLGVILGAAYMLWMVQRVFFGQHHAPREPAPART